jgi:hypothetical protein
MVALGGNAAAQYNNPITGAPTGGIALGNQGNFLLANSLGPVTNGCLFLSLDRLNFTWPRLGA